MRNVALDEQRKRLEARWAAETDPVKREAYALAKRAGFDWYDMESSARRMAEHAAEEILQLRSERRYSEADPDGDLAAEVQATT